MPYFKARGNSREIEGKTWKWQKDCRSLSLSLYSILSYPFSRRNTMRIVAN
ncbi:hypothetical protein HMPREF9018_0546 [Prevotella amnii CRIS 21A-A]|uniref:Uncharacterized protein n=1 Tax=Prevotella amnii CRIS 21A-A TaxID=679191 RepID=E1GWQ5_9BACT|nr:hypothetical protein HMPREF9018_0546 [Prevotella amnii CRIS 21A-A]